MSLAIDVAAVSSVLLNDGWHDVVPGSFMLDVYEYLYVDRRGNDVPLLDIGSARLAGVTSMGFVFRDAVFRGTVEGPITSILAVRRATFEDD